MFEIDKEKFGAFVAQLRKEKGLMQKDLAEKLYVSDKAVSKWERGLSIPDVALLVPLAEILGVTVTELLECRRIPQAEPMDSQQTEALVKKVIVLTAEEQRNFIPDRFKRGIQLLLCALIGCMEAGFLIFLGIPAEELAVALFTMMGLMAGFGLYFCVLAREKLPQYYDENRIDSFSDGPLRMNIPGVHFNNRNWPHILRAGQLWAMIGLVASPLIYFLLRTFFPAVWNAAGVYIILVLTLGGLFVPMIIVGRKYEYAPGDPRPAYSRKRSWIPAAVCIAVVLVLVIAFTASGLASGGSGLRVGWAEGKTMDSWSATYSYHDGYRERTINTDGEPTRLHVEVLSTTGSFGLVVTDTDGNVIFEQENIETSSFDIELPGTVKVRVIGDDHKGSFSMSW